MYIKAFDPTFENPEIISILAEDNNADFLLDTEENSNYISIDGLGIDLNSNSQKFYEQGEYKGYISENLSGANRYNSIIVEIGCTSPIYSKYDISIEFYNNSVQKFDVEVLAGGIWQPYLENVYVENNVAKIKIDSEVVQQFRLLNFYTEFPYQFVKINSFSFGKVEFFTEIETSNLHEETSFPSTDAPLSEFECTLFNSLENKLNINTEISIISNGGYYGTYFVKEITRIGAQKSELRAVNCLSLIENIPNLMQSLQANPRTVVKEDFTSAVKSYSNVDIVGYSTFFPNLDGQVTADETPRQFLSVLAYADYHTSLIDATRTNRVIKIKQVPSSVSSHIASERILGEAVIERKQGQTASACMGISFPIAEKDKVVTLENLEIGKETTYYFDKAVEISTFTGISASSIIQMTAFFVTFIPDATTVTFTYDVINADLQKEIIQSANLYEVNSEFDTSHITFAPDAFDITKNVLQKYLDSIGYINAKFILRGEKIGDLVEIETAYDGTHKGIILSMDISFGWDDIAEAKILIWE